MKTTKTIIAIAAFAVSLFSCAQQPTFVNLAGDKNITTVYVSKPMLKMIGNSGYMGSLPVSTKNLESVEIITCEATDSKDSFNKIAVELDKYLKANPGLQTMVKVNSDGENVNIYGQPKPDSDKFSTVIISVDEDRERTLIVIKGDINPSEINM